MRWRRVQMIGLLFSSILLQSGGFATCSPWRLDSQSPSAFGHLLSRYDTRGTRTNRVLKVISYKA
jgi:hypothetical protein